MGGSINSSQRARRYIFEQMYRVKGYLQPADAAIFCALLLAQTGSGFSGGLAEIGVFYGRSFYLMAMLAADQEKAFAIDLFDIDRRSDGTSGQLDRFMDMGRRLGLQISPDMVFAGSSEQVTAQSIIDKQGKIRFFSVDGGHLLHHVQTDAKIAADSLADYGVIAFDDFCNPEWPEVSLGVFDFLRQNAGAFVPFAISKAKLYVCKKNYKKFYADNLAASPSLKHYKIRQAHMLEEPIALILQSNLSRLMYEVAGKTGFGWLVNAMTRR